MVEIARRKIYAALRDWFLKLQQSAGIGHNRQGAEIVEQRRDDRAASAQDAGCGSGDDHNRPTEPNGNIDIDRATTAPA